MEEKLRSATGIFFALVSAFFYAADGILAKRVDFLTPTELVFWRMLIQSIIIIPFCLYRDYKQYPGSSFLGFFQRGRPVGLQVLLLRGLSGTVTLLLMFKAFGYLPMGDVISNQ